MKRLSAPIARAIYEQNLAGGPPAANLDQEALVKTITDRVMAALQGR